jgi:hypothetical protein
MGALDLGVVGALAGVVERSIVDEGQVGVGTRRIPNLPESDLCVCGSRKSTRNDISRVLLGGDQRAGGQGKRNGRETHLDRNE